MENIDEHLHCRVIRAGDGLGAFDDRVNEVALAAVERFDDERHALGACSARGFSEAECRSAPGAVTQRPTLRARTRVTATAGQLALCV